MSAGWCICHHGTVHSSNERVQPRWTLGFIKAERRRETLGKETGFPLKAFAVVFGPVAVI